jgi:hypothetical protein
MEFERDCAKNKKEGARKKGKYTKKKGPIKRGLSNSVIIVESAFARLQALDIIAK